MQGLGRDVVDVGRVGVGYRCAPPSHPLPPYRTVLDETTYFTLLPGWAYPLLYPPTPNSATVPYPTHLAAQTQRRASTARRVGAS